MNPPDTRFAGGPTVGLFIDADNVDTEVIDHAIESLRGQGLRTTLLRAYGGYDRLGAIKDTCARHGVKMLPNHGRGTTDALLIVDVMDLLHAKGFPDVAAIASADADFAPLAVRLREAGCFTLCFANLDKADGDALKRAYDEVVFVGVKHGSAAAQKAVAKRAAPSRRSPVSAPAPVSPAARTAAPRQDDELPDRVRQLLETLPALREGALVQLNEVVSLLRKEKLLGRTGSGPKFLAKNAPYLRLTPDKQPNKVLWSR